MHSKDFKDMTAVKGRNVLIVGAGKTALDCVAEVTTGNLANSVTHLYRQVGWVGPACLPAPVLLHHDS